MIIVAIKQGHLRREKWSRSAIIRSLMAGGLMAVGVKLAGDCLVGNSFVQTAVFSWQGWLSMGAMMLGIWMVSFLL